MKNIIVGIEFKENEKQLLKMATMLAKPFNSKIWLLHVEAPEPEYVGYSVGPQYIKEERTNLEKVDKKHLQDLAEHMEISHSKVETVLIKGETSRMILEETDKINADLIVLGHHKHNVLYKVFVGSVDKEVIRQSDVPVLIVPL